jgi:predicted transcriptional regulator
MLRESDNMPIERAAEYLNVSRRSVERFMREHPKSFVVDVQDRRRLRRQWADAWTEGRNVVAALERAWAKRP